ncbi:kinase-like protein [Imleria badia]|nr:kinase-like protein [Imleria badia]
MVPLCSREIASRSASTPLQVDQMDLLDLTDTLQRDKKCIAGHGAFGTVYSCLCARNGKVAVKVITLHRCITEPEKDEFIRKTRCELGIWNRLEHPNIAPLLGTTRGEDFGSDYPCLVSMWMSNGTLNEYLNRDGIILSASTRVQLIQGIAAGLAYLHSRQIVHGDFHPGNILIDSRHNARLTDFGICQALSPVDSPVSYLRTKSIRPGAVLFAAPELLHPGLYPCLEMKTTLNSDVYSLGSILLFVCYLWL